MTNPADTDDIGALTIEQEFKLQVIKEDAKKLTVEQAQHYVIETMRQMMIKDNLVKHLLKQNI
jgi:predicted RNA methylase